MEHVAYEGERKRIVWARDGRRFRGKEYVMSLQVKDRARVEALLEFMGDHGLITDKEKFRSEGDGISASRGSNSACRASSTAETS